MTRTVRIEGTEELNRALRKLNAEARIEVKKAIDATGLSLRGKIVKNYQRGPKTGEIYEKSNPTRTHRASAPGEAPATDTGRLASSVVMQSDPQQPLTVEVLTDVEYGPWLEFGTRRIKPRPNWVPTAQAEQPDYVRRVVNAIRRASR